jgi:ATP-dependent RNA helicase DDX24/MAK5
LCTWLQDQWIFADEGFNDFPVDMAYLPAIKKRVSLARRIEKHIHEKRKSKSDADWFRRAAKDMDIDVDEVWGQPAFVARVCC